MAKVALLTIHGMGATQPDYAYELLDALRSRLAGRWPQVSAQAVYYQNILQPNQDAIWKSVDSQSKVHYDELRRFLLFGFSDAAGLENRKEEAGSVYVDAQIEIAKGLLAARQALGGDGPVVAITQSLGCQVFSSYLYDAQKKASGGPAIGIWANIDAFADRIAGRALTPAEKSFLAGSRLQRWVTTGCNIPIFVAAHKRMDIKPIAPPPADGDFRWLNLYDPDDVLGWPLQPLSAGYRALVEDRSINSGSGLVKWILKSWNPMSHSTYWTDGDVLDPLEEMLRTYM